MMPDLTPEQIDLLLSVTDGSLEGEALAAARAVVASDPMLSEELRLQEAARTHLAVGRAAPMADFEAARMRRAVLDEVLPPPAVRTPWRTRLLPAAAVLAVVVAGVGFLGNLTGGRDASITTSDEMAALAPSEKDPTVGPDAADGDGLTEDHVAEMAPAAEDAASDDFAAAAPADFLLPDLGVLDAGPLPEDVLDEMRAAVGGGTVPFALVGEDCEGVAWEDEVLVAVTGAGTGVLDDEEVLVVEVEDGSVLVVDRVACVVVADR